MAHLSLLTSINSGRSNSDVLKLIWPMPEWNNIDTQVCQSFERGILAWWDGRNHARAMVVDLLTPPAKRYNIHPGRAEPHPGRGARGYVTLPYTWYRIPLLGLGSNPRLGGDFVNSRPSIATAKSDFFPDRVPWCSYGFGWLCWLSLQLVCKEVIE